MTLLVALALCSSACDTEARYKDAAEFEAAVGSWRLVGKSRNEAISFLTKQKFSCKERYCYREAKGPVCNQKLRIELVLDKEHKVIETGIWKLPNGQLPSVCL